MELSFIGLKFSLFKSGVQPPFTTYYALVNNFMVALLKVPRFHQTLSRPLPTTHSEQKILLMHFFLIGNMSKPSGGDYLTFTHSFIHKAFTECLLCTSARHGTGQARLLPSAVKWTFRWNQRNASWGDREEGPITSLLLDGFVVLPRLINACYLRGFYRQPLPQGSERISNQHL